MIQIPKLSELFNDILADLESELTVTIPLVGKIFLRALAAVQAAKLKLYYLTIGQLQKNIFVDTADPEATGGTLERFGRIKLNRNPFAATAAQYDIDITGDIGATIPAGTTFKSDDDALNPGKLYILDTEFTLVTSPDTITVRALEAGLDSKLEVNDTLTATAPIATVNKEATVSAENIAPLAAEDIEAYRQLAIDSYRLEPQGGAAADYRLWSANAQGVRLVFPYAKDGAANEINLYVEANAGDSTDGKGTPSQAILDDVESVVEFNPDDTKPLNERGRRPLGVFDIHFLPVTIAEVDIDINGLTATAAEKTAIENALQALIIDIRPFVAAADILANKNDILDTNKIISTILAVKPGAVFGTVTLDVKGTYVNTFTFEGGEIPSLESVSFSS